MKNTIKENRDFKYAYKKGKKIVTPFIVMHYYKNRTEQTKIGITVSTTIGKAHVRNRVKRLVREAYLPYRDKVKKGYNIIWVSRSRTAHAAYDDVRGSVEHCLISANLIETAENG